MPQTVEWALLLLAGWAIAGVLVAVIIGFGSRGDVDDELPDWMSRNNDDDDNNQ